jgi:Methyltransferase domain
MGRIKRALWICRQIAQNLPDLRRLPGQVRRFYLKAWLWALLLDDPIALLVAAPPSDLAILLRLAAGRDDVVELGTGKGWTTAALALAAPNRRVISYDVYLWPTRDRYLALLTPSVRRRIELRAESAESGPAPGDRRVQFLFIDSSHEHEETLATFRIWSRSLTDDAVVAFHDYLNPDYPGVATAIDELALEGQILNWMFVWRRRPRTGADSRGEQSPSDRQSPGVEASSGELAAC